MIASLEGSVFYSEFYRSSGEGMGLAVYTPSQHLIHESLVGLQHSEPQFPHLYVGIVLQLLGHSTFRVLCSCAGPWRTPDSVSP